MHDDDALKQILALARFGSANRAVFLSSGVGSRDWLIKRLVESNIHVTVFHQDPESAPDQTDAGRTLERVRELKDSLGDETSDRWKVFAYRPPAALRAIVLYDRKGHPYAAQAGWYVYLQKPRHKDTPVRGDIRVHGKQNPSMVVTDQSSASKILLDFFDSVVTAMSDKAPSS